MTLAFTESMLEHSTFEREPRIPSSYDLVKKVQDCLATGPQGTTLNPTTQIRHLNARPSAEFYNDVVYAKAKWSSRTQPLFGAELFVANRPLTLGVLSLDVPKRFRIEGFRETVVDYLEAMAKTLGITTIEAHGDVRERETQDFWDGLGYRLHTDGSHGGVWVMKKELGAPKVRMHASYGNPRIKNIGAHREFSKNHPAYVS